MNLSPKLINHLVALKSLLDLGDIELACLAASRLDGERGQSEVDGILGALQDHRFVEAAEIIATLLADGARLVKWTDPEIAMLEAELGRVTMDLADLESERAELEHLVSRFLAAHNEALGWRISQLLQLRMRILEKDFKNQPEVKAEYERARRESEEFERDQEVQREEDARTKWSLSEEEQAELKRAYRRASKLCHPDLAADEHKETAAQMFRELRKAYEEGDLARVRKLEQRAKAGLFGDSAAAGYSDERKKESLKIKIAGIRDALEQARASILEIKLSPTWQEMMENGDWSAMFERQAKILDQEIETLEISLNNASNE